MAIRELLDRGFGKPTQFLATDTDIVPEKLSADELRAQILAEFQRAFPEYRLVPAKRLKVIPGPSDAASRLFDTRGEVNAGRRRCAFCQLLLHSVVLAVISVWGRMTTQRKSCAGIN